MLRPLALFIFFSLASQFSIAQESKTDRLALRSSESQQYEIRDRPLEETFPTILRRNLDSNEAYEARKREFDMLIPLSQGMQAADSDPKVRTRLHVFSRHGH